MKTQISFTLETMEDHSIMAAFLSGLSGKTSIKITTNESTKRNGDVSKPAVDVPPPVEKSGTQETKEKSTPQETQDPATQNETQEPATLDGLRLILPTKVKEHKDAIKAQLKKLGAPSLTELDPIHYDLMRTFLNSL